MPELPEAETIARFAHDLLAGQRLKRVEHLRGDMVRGSARRFRRRLSGSVVVRIRRRGKRVVAELDNGDSLVFALGMSGHVCVPPAVDPVAAHTHLRISIVDSDRELRLVDPRRFGWIELIDRDARNNGSSFAALGLEPMDISLAEFRQLLTRPRQIKALLMDQHVIAGLGNIYCDEALHRAGIHPLEIASSIDDIRIAQLRRAIRSVLRLAIRANGSSIRSYVSPNGGPGSFQQRHRVYGRDGQPCRTCRTTVVRIVAAGRSSHFCPVCQAESVSRRNGKRKREQN